MSVTRTRSESDHNELVNVPLGVAVGLAKPARSLLLEVAQPRRPWRDAPNPIHRRSAGMSVVTSYRSCGVTGGGLVTAEHASLQRDRCRPIAFRSATETPSQRHTAPRSRTRVRRVPPFRR